MDPLVSAVAQHGYSILFFFVFLEVIGVPVPAAPVLLIAGAASANGPLQPAKSLLTALSAMMVGDGLMYLLGRWTGWWLLGVLCRLSLSPESCILRSADAFYKRGRMVLVFAKFVPGISALAVPLAGSMKMRFPQFLLFDLAGASLYTFAYWGVGYLFSDFLGAIVGGYAQLGTVLAWAVALAISGYVVYRLLIRLRERNRQAITKITPLDVARKLPGIVVFDVRSHGYYERHAIRIQGSTRLEPHALHQEPLQVPKDKEIALYCTCVREATSVRVARVLMEQGYRVAVITGGLRACRKAGLPMEPVPEDDIVRLPTFS
jgi:membrane protein DedA with SNARE-associated domain/rhodanese-related sulfurtransferase